MQINSIAPLNLKKEPRSGDKKFHFIPFLFEIEVGHYDKFVFSSITIEVCDEWSGQNVRVYKDTDAIRW